MQISLAASSNSPHGLIVIQDYDASKFGGGESRPQAQRFLNFTLDFTGEPAQNEKIGVDQYKFYRLTGE